MLTSLFAALAPFEPTLVGTFPLGLQVAGSDLDVICRADDFQVFEEVLSNWFTLAGVDSETWQRNERAVSVRFDAMGTAIEVYGEATPVLAQLGYRHMVVEARLLAVGGAALRERVRALKVRGMKTEPAFAHVLELVGDPYLALLELETWSLDELRSLTCMGASESMSS
jgi:hypothetical protein